MSGAIMKCLSVLGILLLILLGLLILFTVLALFLPVTYRISGRKNSTEDTSLKIRISWLFGILRLVYSYPSPGKPDCRLLWFSLFRKRQTGGKQRNKKLKESDEQKRKSEADQGNSHSANDGVNGDGTLDIENESKGEGDSKQISEEKMTAQDSPTPSTKPTADKFSFFQRLKNKLQKIKYTINSTYDKIRHVWDNISYYKALLEDPETNLLWKHIRHRFYKMLKCILPKKRRANVVFGTGFPDTTGYVYGLYGMLLPMLGAEIRIIPDFENRKLEGEIDLSGHIMMGTILFHSICILTDKKLWLFVKRIKSRRKSDG